MSSLVNEARVENACRQIDSRMNRLLSANIADRLRYDPDPRVKDSARYALVRLARRPSSLALDRLLKIALESQADHRKSYGVVEFKKGEQAVSMLVPYKSPRQLATEALKTIGRPARPAIRVLCRVFIGKNKAFAKNAKKALLIIGKDTVVPIIETMSSLNLDESTKKSYDALLGIIYSLGPTKAVPGLAEALDSSDYNIYNTAFEILVDWKDRAIPILVSGIYDQHSDHNVNRMALCELLEQHFGGQTTVYNPGRGASSRDLTMDEIVSELVKVLSCKTTACEAPIKVIPVLTLITILKFSRGAYPDAVKKLRAASQDSREARDVLSML